MKIVELLQRIFEKLATMFFVKFPKKIANAFSFHFLRPHLHGTRQTFRYNILIKLFLSFSLSLSFTHSRSSLSHSLSFSLSLTHSLTHSLTLTLILALSLTHSLTYSDSHSRSLFVFLPAWCLQGKQLSKWSNREKIKQLFTKLTPLSSKSTWIQSGPLSWGIKTELN